MKILILNGPNLNLLGLREPAIYGAQTYDDLVQQIREHAATLSVDVKFYQSNHEGDLVDAIHRAYFEKFDGIVFNPAAYTHTSIAIADAIQSVSIPTVEVHISDIRKREAFRQISYVKDVCVKSILGEGFRGYCMALDYLVKQGGSHEG